MLRNTPGVQSISVLESSAPSFPVASTSAAAQAQASKTSSDAKGKGKARAASGKESKPRHKLPKGAVLGQKFEEDVSHRSPLPSLRVELTSRSNNSLIDGFR